MGKAKKVEELVNAFSKTYNYENLDNFTEFYNKFETYYVEDTIKSRTGNSLTDPIKEIAFEIKLAEKSKSFLFLGHKGCGKSTELIRLRKILQDNNFIPFIIDTEDDLDKDNIDYTDFLALMLDKLLNIAVVEGIEIEDALLEQIENYWGEKIITKVDLDDRNLKVKGAVEGKAKLLKVIKFSAGISSEIKKGYETRTEIRSVIKSKTSQLIKYIEEVADRIDSDKLVLIFENLDKIKLDTIGNVFRNNSSVLTNFKFHTVYTFPISLRYSLEFNDIRTAYKVKPLPMIKVKDINRKEYPDGINVLKDIVIKRANPELFDEGVIEKAILMSGGAIRILFDIISNSALKAYIAGLNIINNEVLDIVIDEMSNDYSFRLSDDKLKYLKNIINSTDVNTRRITEDLELNSQLFDNLVLLEYNGVRWFDVNPLVKKYIEGLGDDFK